MCWNVEASRVALEIMAARCCLVCSLHVPDLGLLAVDGAFWWVVPGSPAVFVFSSKSLTPFEYSLSSQKHKTPTAIKLVVC